MEKTRVFALSWAAVTAVLLLVPGGKLPDSGLSEVMETAIEQGVHFFLFFGLARLAGRGYAALRESSARRSRILAAVLAYCVLLEILQIAVPGRGFELMDIAVGWLGTILGLSRPVARD